jgi:protocatechuate 3,4-dioxygenase beta subunit
MYKRTVVIFLMLLTYGALHLGQGSARIFGVVLNAETALPLSGVRIELAGTSSTLQTAEDGSFSFSSLRPGRYRVVPILAGYVQVRTTAAKSSRDAGSWVQLSNGSEEGIELRMEREASLTGRVVDGKGKPLPGLLPSLLRYRYDEFGNLGLAPAPGTPIGSAFSRPKTDDRGEFRIYGLQPGEYYVWVPSAFYPGTRDRAQAIPVNLKSGENRPIAITVPDEINAPLRTSVTLRLSDEIPDTIAAEVQTGNDGGFIAFGPFTKQALLPNFPLGQFDVFIRWRNSTFTDLIYSRLFVDTGGGPVVQDVSVERGVKVEGHVTLRNESQDLLSLEKVRCGLRSLFTGAVEEQPGLRCLGGHYAVGQYRLEMENLPEDAYVASITQPGSAKDLLAGPIEITQQQTKLDVLVVAPGGIVEGVARDSKGNVLEGATVVAVPEESLRSSWLLYRSVISDVKGRFQLRGIAPGNYSLFVWSELEGPAFRNTEFLKAFEDRAVRIHIGKDRLKLDLMSF